MKSLRQLLFAGATLLLPIAAQAAVQFQLTFTDQVNHTGVNWDDPVYGAQARQALTNSMNLVGAELAGTQILQVKVDSDSFATNIVANYVDQQLTFDTKTWLYDSTPGTFTKINTGFDSNGSIPDGQITWGFNLAYNTLYNDLNGNGVIEMNELIAGIPTWGRWAALRILGMGTTFSGAVVNRRYDAFLYYKDQTTAFNRSNTVAPAYFKTNDTPAQFLPLYGDNILATQTPQHDTPSTVDRQFLRTFGYTLTVDIQLQLQALNLSSSWFGSFDASNWPWIYTSYDGWLYAYSHAADGLWLYHSQLGWLFTSPSVYPWFWAYDPSYEGIHTDWIIFYNPGLLYSYTQGWVYIK